MSNKYFFRAKISEEKFRTVLRLFYLDMEAKSGWIYRFESGHDKQHLQQIFASVSQLCAAESPFSNGEIELDESYFGARRVREIRGRGAKGKILVFGMLKRGDKVYANRQKLFCK